MHICDESAEVKARLHRTTVGVDEQDGVTRKVARLCHVARNTRMAVCEAVCTSRATMAW